MSHNADTIVYGTLYSGGLDADIPLKIVRRKIRGRKF